MVDTCFNILRKSIMAVVITLFTFAVVYVPQPNLDGGYHNVEVAEAGGSFVDPVNLVQNTITAVQSAATFVAQNWLVLKEQVLDGIAWVVAKQILNDLTASVVDWVNSGFDGSPAFVQNLEDFLLEAGDKAVGQFIKELGGLGSFVCSPFQFNVQLAVALQADLDRIDTEVECTVTDIFNNINEFENFIAGDFQNQGWEGWLNIVNNPNNTPYGATLAAQTEVRSRVADAQQTETKLLDFGSGFLSYPECETVSNPRTGVDESECHIKTPGDVIAGSINKSLGAGQDQLVAADEFNEIIGALIANLVGGVLSSDGLLGQSGGGGFTGYSRAVTFEDDVRRSASPFDPVTITPGTGGTSLPPGGLNLGGGGNQSGQQLIASTLADQQRFIGAIDDYVDEFNDFITNPFNDDAAVQTVDLFLTEAENLQTRVNNSITVGTNLQLQYDTLESEYPSASPSRQQEIRNLQAAILQDFVQLNNLTQGEFDIYTNQWDQVLTTDWDDLFDDDQQID
jgi:hypothetical protein